MFLLTRFLLLICVMTMSCSFKAKNKDVVIKAGNVTYSFASGKLQCQAQIDSEGHTFVLLKSLDKNTTLTFSNVLCSKNSKTKAIEFVVKVLMAVKEDTDICAGWINAQEVSIKIDPLPTKTVSLTGTKVYDSNQITVMIL